MVHIGAYEFDEQLGHGAAGRVLGGVHLPTGTLVAAKFARADAGSFDAAQSALLREIQTIAALDHPAIVAVLDGGLLPSSFIHHGARYDAGCPYMVVERASATLSDVDVSGWDELRAILVTLLEGLAFAHSHGVVHRDLKPENVLRVGDAWKIGDFGLSGFFARRQAMPSAGTPLFMAPEQFRGAARDLIPATDLYAVGGVAHFMAAGVAPFEGKQYLDLAQAHMEEPPPFLDARFDVPDGFALWVRRLLAKRQVERFLRAADALAALLELGTTAGLQTRPISRLRMSTVDEFAVVADRAPPPTWRRDLVSRTDELVAASASLFGIRSAPFVGRDAERDQVWEALTDVSATGRARVVVLEGPTGCGKSRLATWICERADEVGAASYMVARGDRARGGTRALMDMVATYLRSADLDRADARSRAEQLFELYGLRRDWRLDALERLLIETSRDGDETELDGGERQGLLWALFQSASAGRSLIVFVDDAHHCEEALEMIRAGFVDGRPRLSVLFVLTVQVEALAEEPSARELLGEVLKLEGASRVLIDELSRAEARTLLRELLRLDDRVIKRLSERVGGNPLFAVQLVSDWVARDAIAYRKGRLELDPQVWSTLPDSIWRVWSDRVLRAIGPEQPEARRALELAAILGREVDAEEWAGVCGRAGIDPPRTIVARLAASGLLRPERRGWVFVHEMLREALLRDCRESGRWESGNRLVGTYLEDYSRALPLHDRLGRVARHLLEARDPRAGDVLCAAANHAVAYGDRYFALELIGLVEQQPDVELETVLRSRLIAAEALGRLGRIDAALDIGRATVRTARANGWSSIEAEALMAMASNSRLLGRLHESAQFADTARGLFEETGSTEGVARATLEIADAYVYMARHLEAVELYQATRLYFAEHDLKRFFARAEYGIGYAHLEREELDVAEPHIRQAHETYLAIGADSEAFTVLLSMGDLARYRGDLDLADQHYRQCLDYFESTGDGTGAVSYLNLGFVALARGDFESARGFTEYARESLERYGLDAFRAGLHALALACDAAERDWRSWDANFAALPKWVERTGVLERDDILTVERAAGLALRAGERSRAARAYELAEDLWTRANNTSDAARVREISSKLN